MKQGYSRRLHPTLETTAHLGALKETLFYLSLKMLPVSLNNVTNCQQWREWVLKTNNMLRTRDYWPYRVF